MTRLFPAHRLPALSVRLRIALIGLVPLVGLAAVALAAFQGQRLLDQARALEAEAGRTASTALELRLAAAAMSAASTEFMVKRSYNQETEFRKALAEARARIETLTASPLAEGSAPQIQAVRRHLDDAERRFKSLVGSQDVIGRGEAEGLRGELRSFVTKAEAQVREAAATYDGTDHVLAAILEMRRIEKDFMLTGRAEEEKAFDQARIAFGKALLGTGLPAPRRLELGQLVARYAGPSGPGPTPRSSSTRTRRPSPRVCVASGWRSTA
jgi:methyl-accepting chemotaxis protein